jgi:sugar phosphate isomerase/epimerase
MATDNRPITLFTGQWTDLPLARVAELAAGWGYDGLEIDCSGAHIDPLRALEEDGYLESIRETLDRHGLGVWAISNHVAGHAVADPTLDFRMKDLIASRIWGDGDIEGIHERAAEEMVRTARVAARLDVKTVVGFTGSPVWQYVVGFPGAPQEIIERGFKEFADRWNPILDAFDEHGVRFALEVHPSEIAYDYWTAVATLDAIGRRAAFGFNWDPSPHMWQGIDPANIQLDVRDRI